MFDWREFLALAEELAGRGDDASKRSAISRAYYCAFHYARQFVEEQGVWVPTDGKAHTVVWETLEREGKARRRVGCDGKRLRVLRCMADYESRVNRLALRTVDAVAVARQIVILLDAEARSQRS